MELKQGLFNVAMIAACPFPCGRGTPVRIQRMAESLAHRGHRMHVAAYHLAEPIAMCGSIAVHRNRSIPTYKNFSPGPTLQKLLLVDGFLQVKLRDLLRGEKIDVIHAHHVEGLLVALLARRVKPHLPIVFDAHTLLESELPFYMPAWTKPLFRKLGFVLDKRLSGRAEHLITVTEELRQQLLRLNVVTAERSTTVSNGVELEPFADYRWSPRSDSGQCTLVYSGNLAQYQGIECMLRAFATIERVDVVITLRIVTQSSFEKHEALCDQLGISERIEVIKAGFDRVPELLASADIALNPRVEAPGLPQKTMNYLAAGMPVVSFAGSGHHLVHEQTALLVDGDSVEGFAAAIERLIDDPSLAAHISQHASRVAQARSWEQSAEQIERIYQQLCKPI